MQELIDKVQELVAFELERANTIHPPKFNSMHEAYAVMLEEVEEMSEAVNAVLGDMKELWAQVRTDDLVCQQCLELHGDAVRAAAEMIQVAAMAKKMFSLD